MKLYRSSYLPSNTNSTRQHTAFLPPATPIWVAVRRLRAITPVITFQAMHFRDRQQRELLLSGLRLAINEKVSIEPAAQGGQGRPVDRPTEMIARGSCVGDDAAQGPGRRRAGRRADRVLQPPRSRAAKAAWLLAAAGHRVVGARPRSLQWRRSTVPGGRRPSWLRRIFQSHRRDCRSA